MSLIIIEQMVAESVLHSADYLVTAQQTLRNGVVLIKKHRSAKGLSHDMRPITLQTPTIQAYRHDEHVHAFNTEGAFVQHFTGVEPTFVLNLTRPSLVQCWQVFHGHRRVSVRYILVAPHGTELLSTLSGSVKAQPGGIWQPAKQPVEVCNGHSQLYDPALVSVFFFQAH